MAEDHEQQDETAGTEPTVRPVTAAARRERRASARTGAPSPASGKAAGQPKTAARRRTPPTEAQLESGKATVSKADLGVATRKRDAADKRPSIIARFLLFVREVIGELRKVIWPTRKQQITYTVVVLVFIAFIVAFVAGLDYGFTKLMFVVFS